MDDRTFHLPQLRDELRCDKRAASRQASGSFECAVCKTEVHAWSGLYDFFDWKAIKTRSPVFGKKEVTDKLPMASSTKA
jgi:hypothetical protein